MYSKLTIYQTVRTNIIKLPEENLCDFGLDNQFLPMTPKANIRRKKLMGIHYNEKNTYALKDIIKEVEIQAIGWKVQLQSYI